MSQSTRTPPRVGAQDAAGESGKTAQPSTQGQTNFRQTWPVWMQELPYLRFKPEQPDPNFQLIKDEDLQAILKDADPAAVQRIREDMAFLDHELLRLFRERDHAAKMQQNRYRFYQLTYLILAAIATAIGSFQALALTGNPVVLPLLAFAETVVALIVTYLATISGREPPMPMWLTNRRRAEQLRREYFRYLMNLPPFDQVTGYQRSMLLSKRAADINRGVYPEEPGVE